MATDATRISRNMDTIRLLRARPQELTVKMQLADDEIRWVHRDPLRFRPTIWREGQDVRLAAHGATARWLGGGWWEVSAPRRRELDKVLAGLVGHWRAPQVQLRLDLPPPPQRPASREVAMAAIAKCRAILAGRG